MSGSNARSNAIRAITSYKPDLAPLNYADTKPTEIYGSNVFSDKVMKERLPRIVYKSLRKTIEQGVQLDPSLADIVASTMKDWAIEKGATHFTHVFYPLTGHSAEKHDGFLSPDGNGGVITEFSDRIHISHILQIFVIPGLDLLDLMRCTETIEEVDERNFTLDSCQMSNWG